MIPINQILLGNNADILREFPDQCIDLVVTSPPYDNVDYDKNGNLTTIQDGVRKYGGYVWDFVSLAKQLYRVIKQGGVIVWVVADKTDNGTESGSSFRQALYFKSLGFNLHDTMIYHRKGLPMSHNRYEQHFEYMFVLSKGKPKTSNLITKKNVYGGKARNNKHNSSSSRENNSLNRHNMIWEKVNSESVKGNVWEYAIGITHSSKDEIAFQHPAIFPEQLAIDHIKSWSNPGDLVLDPFMGSGTVAKASIILDRQYIGIEVNQAYIDIANERVAKVSCQPKLIPVQDGE